MVIPPQISVIIPINDWNFVKNNIQRLLSEKETKHFKFIFVLDSCNKYAKISLNQIILDYEIINFLILSANFGSAALARNEGLQNVETNWVCFWDSDDLPNLKNFFELYKNSLGRNINLVVGQMETIYLSDQRVNRKVETNTNSLTALALNLGFTRILYETKFIKGLFFPNIDLGEDVLFLAKVVSRSPKILYSSLSVYIYKNYNWKYRFNDNKTILNLFELYALLNGDRQEVKEMEANTFYFLITLKLLLGITKRVIFRDLKSTLICLFYLQKLIRFKNIYRLISLKGKTNSSLI